MRLTNSEKWLLAVCFLLLALVMGLLGFFSLIDHYWAGFGASWCIYYTYSVVVSQRENSEVTTESEKLLLGIGLILVAVVAGLLNYGGMVSHQALAGGLAAFVMLVAKIFWAEKLKRSDRGGFPDGVNQK